MKKIILSSLLFLSFFSLVSADSGMGGFSLRDALDVSLQSEGGGFDDAGIEYLPGSDKDTRFEDGDPARFAQILQNIMNGLSGAAAAVAIFFIVLNAIKLTFSVGESDEITNAKKGIVWALAGLLLIVFAYIIAKTVISVTYVSQSIEDSEKIEDEESTTKSADHEAISEEGASSEDVCSKSIPNSLIIPESCYGGDATGVQHKTSSCEGVLEELKEVCLIIGLSESCNMKSIQSKLGGLSSAAGDYPSGSYYERSGAASKSCSLIDGKYGQCTANALKLYQKEFCD